MIRLLLLQLTYAQPHSWIAKCCREEKKIEKANVTTDDISPFIFKDENVRKEDLLSLADCIEQINEN